MPYTPKIWNLTDPITDTDLNRIETGVDSAMDQIETHLADDTGWISTGIVAASGWSLASASYRRIGKVCHVKVAVSRTGGDIGLSTNGRLTAGAATITTGIPASCRPSTFQGIGAGAGMCAAFTVEPDGDIKLHACGNQATITAGTAFQASGTYLVG